MHEQTSSRIAEMKQFVLKHVPYYREHVPHGLEQEGFSAFPVINKQTVRENGASFLSDTVQSDQLLAELTSGSTGHPMTLYKTRREKHYLEMLLYRKRKQVVPEISRLTQIKFYAALNNSERSSDQMVLRDGNMLYLSMLDLSPENMERYCNVLAGEKKAAWIMGAPSAISQLAQHIVSHGHRIPSIAYVELTGEMVFDTQRKLIEAAFQCPVRNHYGAREFWAVAYECSCGNMHILDDHVFAENINDEVVVSTLDQYTMPLIRYRLGDIGRIVASECACGQSAPILQTFGGRTTEYIRLSSGKVVNSIVVYMAVLDANEKYDDAIVQFQATQNGYRQFELALVVKERTDCNALAVCMAQYLRNLLDDPEIEINFTFPVHIKQSENGKYKYFISNM